MKLLLLSVLISVSAGEPIDLGTITPRRAIVLERNTGRPDWSHFKVEFFSLALTSNQVTLILTNELLTISNLVGLPSGPTIVGLRSVTLDGMESPIVLFRLDIRRAEPPSPGARVINIGKTNTGETIHGAIERHRQSRELAPPPIPGQTNRVDVSELPNGISKTYSQYQDELADERRRNR